MATNPERKPVADNARSSMNLPGGRPGSAPLSPNEARELLNDGAKRARNIAHALKMIASLLAKHLVGLARQKLQGSVGQFALLGSRIVKVAFLLVKPQLEKLRARAEKTRVKAFKVVLVALIMALGPLEQAGQKIVGAAKVGGAKIAEKGTVTLAQIVTAMISAVGQAAQAGFKKATVQKLLGRVVALLEQADHQK